ncbi:MAG TPA: hypothetical protein VLR71_02165 [Casimicrobiaceae bacterium]|nr:hypothetical protein [Casimicrobiaceae bacterium]
MRFPLVFVLAAVAAAPVFAQTTAAPAAGAAAPAADIPKHNCGKPGEFPGGLASDSQKRAYQKEFVAYTDCLKKFATDEQKLAEPHAKAANEAANEYNSAVKAFNEQVEKEKERSK